MKPIQRKIKTAHFIVDAMIDFNLIKHVDSTLFEITLDNYLVSIVDKKSKASYLVPLSNIRTLVLQ